MGGWTLHAMKAPIDGLIGDASRSRHQNALL